MKKHNILSLYRLPNTVFTIKDIAMIWEITDLNLVKSRIHYYVKTGKLYSPRRGIYTKGTDYDPLELATRIYTLSYVSLETVLAAEGIIFQNYSSIFAISYLSREILCDDRRFIYRKIKDAVLSNTAGVVNKETYFIASKERAFLDVLYLYKEYYFDNLNSLNWEFCFSLVPIYGNKKMEKNVNEYYRAMKNA